jgi:hypothetical protein
MSTGPFLYDEGPENLHTGAPRSRHGLLLAVFGGTALLAVLLVVALPLVKGSAGDQARETAGVFLAALEQKDTETAYQLLCEKERARLQPGDLSAAYLTGKDGRVVATKDGRAGAQQVAVRWADGSTSRWTVIGEGGARVCGTTAGG